MDLFRDFTYRLIDGSVDTGYDSIALKLISHRLESLNKQETLNRVSRSSSNDVESADMPLGRVKSQWSRIATITTRLGRPKIAINKIRKPTALTHKNTPYQSSVYPRGVVVTP